MQILVRAGRADLSAAVAALRDAAPALPHPALEQAALEHAAFLEAWPPSGTSSPARRC